MIMLKRLDLISTMLSYALLLSIGLIGSNHNRTSEEILAGSLISIAGLMSLWAIFQHPKYFHWLLLPVFLAIPAEAYLRVNFQLSVTAHHLGLIAETSPREALELLGAYIWPVLGCIVGTILWWGFAQVSLSKDMEMFWSGPTRWVALIGAALMAWTLFYHQQTVSVSHKKSMKAASSLFNENLLRKSWPLSVYVAAYDFHIERSYLSKLNEASNSFKFMSKVSNHSQVAPVVVLIIGESSRFDRWSLNGYARDTTPLLRDEPNVVSLTDVVTPFSSTRKSVPIILTRKTVGPDTSKAFNEKSVLTAFKEAGYKTYWISNQLTFGKFDTPITAYAQEADIVKFLNIGDTNSAASYDEVLLGTLTNVLKGTEQKKFIVLHTMGSHWNYSQRHSVKFDKWTPTLRGIENPPVTDIKIKLQLNNSYDNTILYTDWFLTEVIRKLKETNVSTAMMYTADHGQLLFDGACPYAFHGRSTAYEFQVPAIVWYSNQYRAQFSSKVKYLVKHRDAPLSTENIFHSVVDMAGVSYPHEWLNRSLFSAAFSPSQRLVDSETWLDYDATKPIGDCRDITSTRLK